MIDFVGNLRKTRKELARIEYELEIVLHGLGRQSIELSESGGANPVNKAVTELAKVYEGLIVSKLWVTETLERIGFISEDNDVYVPEIPLT